MVHDHTAVAAHFDSRTRGARIESSPQNVRATTHRSTARALLAAALSACLGAPAPALANGRFPAAQHFVGGVGDAASRLAVRTTFGILTSADDGRSWRYLCEDLLGLSNTSTWDAPIVIAPDGALFAGLPDGLARVTDGCAAPRVSEVGGDFSADLTATRDGATVYWVGSSGPTRNRVLASIDGGRTWEMRGAARDGVLLETIEASDADPRRVYVSAVQLEPRAYLLLRSDDGARTFREIPIPRADLAGAYLAGLDGDRADGVWLRCPLRADGGPEGGTALLHSDDGGARFTEVSRTRGPMMGFAIRDDGTVWYGGPDDGLWRRARGGPPESIASIPLTCLRWHRDALYACANHARTGWAVARSRDDGARFDPVLRFEDILGPPVCARGTLGADVCSARWSALRRTLQPDAGSTPDAGRTTPDATPPEATPSSGGCACATPFALRARGTASALALGALAFLRRRRRP